MSTHDRMTVDTAVVGGGPAGLLCALLLGRANIKTALVRKKMAVHDTGRTVALMQAALAMLNEAGVWPAISAHSAPLQAMRLIDATRNILRAPTVVFKAEEIGLDMFGANISNHVLQRALEEAVTACACVSVFDTFVDDVVFESDGVVLKGDGVSIHAKLVAAADGGNSKLREAAAIETRHWRYPQTATTAVLEHSVPHHHVSTEFHTRHGPCTFVPMPGNASSLVWVASPKDADHLMALPDAQFCKDLEQRTESLLGKFTLITARAAWPLQGVLPQRFAAKRIALVGEAAHVLPPLGAQGLNLGFRDAALLATLAGKAVADKKDPGGLEVTEAYHQGRKADIRLRSFGVDGFNRSLLSAFLPVHALRGFGLYLAAANPLFRKALMRAGLAA